MTSTVSAPSVPTTLKRLTGAGVFAVMLIPAVWLVDTTIMAPALGPIGVANPEASSFWINVVFTIPYLTSIIFSAVAGRLAQRIDKKVLTVVGLALYGIAGILQVTTGSLEVIFVLRLVTGVGLGLALPMPSVYISEFYEDHKRERMLGLANAVAQVANIVVLVVAGWLLTFGWRNVFWAYGLVLVIAIVSLLWLPRSRPVPGVVTAAVKVVRGAEKFPFGRVIGIAVAMVFLYVAFAFAAANISEFVVEFKVAAVGSIGLIATAPAIGNILGSVLSERLRVVLKSWLVFAALVAIGAGMIIYSGAQAWYGVVLAAGLAGLGVGLLTPYLLNLVTHKVTPQQRSLALGIVSAGLSLGLLAFPYIQQLMGLTLGSGDLRVLFAATAVIVFAVAAAVLVGVVVGAARRRLIATSTRARA
ncbi:MFS transporter [Microbacterium protaetiae]|uniref:MFS transporter n=1 Tax=Microbacterium protaetiae TaxID=2509458 RepID=A0A4P6EBI3_9MICO|nr:MFS transporter [Microbacterium protaetiae]QAY59552.1 MFS transporter [Microbacterium protaetiae]